MGAPGRKWRLPDGASEVEARNALLGWLGLDESAITDSPERAGPDSVLVVSEVYTSERDWLDGLASAAGLTKQASPARALRVLIRAAITNRDLLPVHVEMHAAPPWLAAMRPVDRQERMRRWLDALSPERLDELLIEVQSAIRRRE